MWNKILGINSFIFWPLSLMFLVYALGHTVLTLQWKMLVVAIIIFAVFTIAEVALSILSE